ncbi:MAG TPA: SDR family NAD(P)-dependent oxidoreductase [Anaerolineales bacterium]|nr:SDR family NAD(P)-dependent oxidoreductase [Anaerolineales bacterium]
MTSMKNKRVVITGPTSGVGKETALQLAALGAEVILGCRDLAAGRSLASDITRLTGSSLVVPMHIDTSSQESIRRFARDFRKKYRRLHVLINNASGNRGTLPKVDSVDSIELTFATNVLGYFLLTQELLDTLVVSAPSRIINVASQFASDLDLDDLEFDRRPFESFKAYAQSKACDRLLTWALARRLKGTGVTANAMTPGLITETRLYRNAPPELVERLTVYSGGRTIEEGAETLVWLASSPDVEGLTNKFFEDREDVKCDFRNRKDEEKLWKICTDLTLHPPAGKE